MTDPRSFFPADRFGEVRDIVPIAVGLSGAASYAVTTSRGSFVLRIQGDDRATWRRAVAMQQLAAEHGVAPPLELIDEAQAASVSVKVEGVPLGAALAEPAVRPAALADLVQRVVALHATPASAVPDFVLDAPSLAEDIWRAQVRRPGFPAWAASFGQRLAAATAVLARDPRRVVSHGDLHPANVLWDGARTWLLDWERAGLAHPHADLATLTTFMNLPDAAAFALLAAQERVALDEVARQTFRAARQRVRIVYGAVFLRLAPDLTTAPIARREETPTLAECYERMRAGTLSSGNAEGQALIGAALLRQVEDGVR
jgi:aminoglycoside phosphotransferase (APT) family kinase protein